MDINVDFSSREIHRKSSGMDLEGGRSFNSSVNSVKEIKNCGCCFLLSPRGVSNRAVNKSVGYLEEISVGKCGQIVSYFMFTLCKL